VTRPRFGPVVLATGALLAVVIFVSPIAMVPPAASPDGVRPGTGSLYSITFSESSLLNGISWYVNVSGQSSRSATVTADGGGATIVIPLPNGTYGFDASTNSRNYTWLPVTGTEFNVSGAPGTIPVYFRNIAGPAKYAVEFEETGLPSGDWFNVTVDGRNLSVEAPNPTVTDLTNGTYAYTVADDPPYDANVTNGTFTVHGRDLTVAVGFTRSNPSSSSIPWVWVAAALGIAIAVLALVFLLGRRRRTRATASAPTSSPPNPVRPPPSDPPGPDT
jgi:hypothetical protein